jgi:acyl-CoA thioester hydrolase
MRRRLLEHHFTTEIRVTRTDIDPAGLVYFGSYLYFLARAEDDFFRSLGHPLPEFERQLRVKLFREDVRCRYHRAVRYGDVLVAAIWVSRARADGITYRFEIRKREDQTLAAEGYVTMVALARDTLQPIDMPKAVISALVAVMSTEPPRLAR